MMSSPHIKTIRMPILQQTLKSGIIFFKIITCPMLVPTSRIHLWPWHRRKSANTIPASPPDAPCSQSRASSGVIPWNSSLFSSFRIAFAIFLNQRRKRETIYMKSQILCFFIHLCLKFLSKHNSLSGTIASENVVCAVIPSAPMRQFVDA